METSIAVSQVPDIAELQSLARHEHVLTRKKCSILWVDGESAFTINERGLPMLRLSRWFDIEDLSTPFLAINVSNRTREQRQRNDEFLQTNQTGYWLVPKLAFEQGIEGRTIILFHSTQKGSSNIYVGTCVSSSESGRTKNNLPRYTLTAKNPWKCVGVTEVTFTEMFRGFTMSANPTVVWADIERYTSPRGEEWIDGDCSDDSGGYNKPVETSQRVGHAIFVQRLMTVWKGRCALTGLKAPRLVQACHIVPWSEATPSERVSKDNGLLLCAHLHALLDSHLLGFDEDGRLLLDNSMDAELRELVLAGGANNLSKRPTKEQAAFLDRQKMAARQAGHVLVRV